MCVNFTLAPCAHLDPMMFQFPLQFFQGGCSNQRGTNNGLINELQWKKTRWTHHFSRFQLLSKTQHASANVAAVMLRKCIEINAIIFSVSLWQAKPRSSTSLLCYELCQKHRTHFRCLLGVLDRRDQNTVVFHIRLI